MTQGGALGDLILFLAVVSGVAGVWYLVEKIRAWQSRRAPRIERLTSTTFAPGTALGIEGRGFSWKIEDNVVIFHHEDCHDEKRTWKAVNVTGGATAPRLAVLTVAIPENLVEGAGFLTVSRNGSRTSNRLDFTVVASPDPPCVPSLGTIYALGPAHAAGGCRIV